MSRIYDHRSLIQEIADSPNVLFEKRVKLNEITTEKITKKL